MIDIVVPIFNAPEDVRKCVASVIAHTDVAQYTLTLIDDGSPDPQVKAVLAAIAQSAPKVHIHANPTNLGFTATVNRAFALTQSDVLLLNSDTVVTPGWLAAIAQCAASDHRIATITPFSNNAEIASVPTWLTPNPVPTPEQAAQMARACAEAFAELDANAYPDLPTGVGFCMFVRRAAIHAIGPFDVETFGRGYGEENDWCQRALKAGWRNVLCPSAYVVHTGGQSFSDAKKALVEANIVKLNRKHPGYDLAVQQFIVRDPIAPFRAALASRLSAISDARPGVLHILHGKDGGLERHARDLVQSEPDVRHYILLALDETWTIEDHSERGYETASAPKVFSVRHAADELWRDFFDGVCERFRVGLVHVHHISACRDGLLLALKETAIPYIVTLHDFYYGCATVHLMRGDDTYCGGQTDLSVCQRCVDNNPSAPPRNVVEWRTQNAALLSRARRVIAPSAFTAETTRRYFPTLAIDVVPHRSHVATHTLSKLPSAQIAAAPEGWTTLAVVGAIGPLKGARVVERMAQRLTARQLPARLVNIGYMDKQFKPTMREKGRWVVHGKYAPETLPSLLQSYATDLVIFPAVGPETFGFALSEVWQAGYAPVVSDVGTLAERVRAADAGWICPMPGDTDEAIDAWLDTALLHARPENANERRARAARGNAAVVSDDQNRNAIYGDCDSKHDLNLRPLPVRRWLLPLDAPSNSISVHSRAGFVGKRFDAWFQRIAQFGLRFRHSALGRLAERQLSPSAKRQLRTWLTRG